MGADAAGKQELQSEIINDAQVFIDDFEQTTHSGEINVPLTEGSYHTNQIAGTLGDLINGKVSPRNNGASPITLFDSTGLAIQDLAVARVIFEAAEQRDLGQSVNFLS
jgi:ornithine cyclodeaminase/alanine dehydrogenase